MKLEDIEVGAKYIWQHSTLTGDKYNGRVVIMQTNTPDRLFGMLNCVTEDGVEGCAFPEELSPLPEEN